MAVKTFDAYEMNPVYEDPEKSCFRANTIEEAQQRAKTEGGDAYWSLYGHLPEGGCEWLADRGEFELIAELYSLITGCEAPTQPRSYVNLPRG